MIEGSVLIWYFIRSIIIFFPITYFGAFLSNLLHELGIFRRIEPYLEPFVKFLKVPTFLLPAIISSLINLRLEHVIVYSFYSKGLINDKFIIYYNLIMSPLRHIHLMMCYLIPISIPTLGLYAGLLYVMFLFTKSLLTAILGYIYGMFIRKNYIINYHNLEADTSLFLPHESKNIKTCISTSLRYSLKLLKRLSIRFLIVMSIMLILILLGIFQLLNHYLENLLKPIFQQYNFKSELISVIVISTIYPMIAPFIAGSFLASDVLSIKEVLLGLLLGSMLFMVFFDFTRHSFPFFASIYPLKLAFKLSLSLVIASVITTPILIAILLLLPI